MRYAQRRSTPLTDDRLQQIRVTRDIVYRGFFGRASATGRAINDLLGEVDRLRAEEDAEGREIGRLHDALEAYRNKLATARAALKGMVDNYRGYHVGAPCACYSCEAMKHARKALEEIK